MWASIPILAALAYALTRSTAPLEVGAKYQSKLTDAERAARAKRAAERLATLGRAGLEAERQKRRERDRRRRAKVDCCDAPADDWREAGRTYRDWLPPDQTDAKAAYQLCFRESQEYAAAGDYGKPADRRCVLGKMHQAKRVQWDECRSRCRGSGLRGLETWTDGAVQWFTGDEGRTRAGIEPLGADEWQVWGLTPDDAEPQALDVVAGRSSAEQAAWDWLTAEDVPF